MFTLSDDQRALQEAARAAAQSILAGTLKEDDEAERFRKDQFEALGDAGLCGIPTAERFGGLGLGYLEYALVLEEIARVSASYAVTVAVNGLPQIILAQYGDDAQRERWMPGLASGKLLGAFALSEPGSGSDAASLTTTAKREGDEWVLNGTKFWITHGGYADVYVVMARSGGPGPRGISAFLVPAGTPGLSYGKKEEKMGLRASPTAEIILENARIPAANLIGQEGEGFRVALSALDSGRITIGAIAVGICQASLDVAAAYACQRQQFKQPIIDFQAVGFMLADMACKTETARLLVHKAACLRDRGEVYTHVAAMAKCVATDAGLAVSQDAVQVLGGYGYTREYPVERYMRDSKVMQIVEGTNQVQRLVIARHLKRQYEGA
ncbi:MAG: acyl-CoA dehydrogenase family protein [Deltaproteobacteria bacterium]|nr:acyl-CoA dehydrogenase family protein [Deltaproteobacteria bacterium]MBK9646514.1 acyl-CoA dehydrogenase family protein [Deltaproteobacteria bacterium]